MGKFFNDKIKNLHKIPNSKTMEEMRKEHNQSIKVSSLPKLADPFKKK